MCTEEEFKPYAVQLIEFIVSSLGLNLKTYEYSVISGEKDTALFNHVLIQYNAPGSLSTDSGFSTAQAEMIDSITLEGNGQSAFGILLSDCIAFVRFNGRWVVQGPYEIKKSTMLKVLGALRGLKKRKFSK